MDPQMLRDSWKDYVAPSAPCTMEDMNKRVARFGEIPASPRAFVDTYVKGHERVLYSVIGSGVSDDPNFKPKIAAAENFHVDYITAAQGCGAALHWHDSEEVFVVQSGRWEVDWIDGTNGINGINGQKHTVTLNPRDTISVPPFVHRAFRSLDGESGMLISILGGKTPGRVMWDQSLANQAKAIGVGFDAQGMAHQAEE